METLQKAIEKRAIAKLSEKLNEINKFLSSTHYNFLQSAGDIHFKQGEKATAIQVRYIMSNDYGIRQKVYDAQLPLFIEAETKLFLAEIEELKAKSEELTEQVNNLTGY